MNARRVVAFGMTTSKYGAKPTTLLVDGEQARFASKREAEAFTKLRILERADRIRNLQRQVAFRLDVGGFHVCKYIADFTFEEYQNGEWVPVVADAKGYPTQVYKLKKKLMKACHGVEIREL